MSKQLEFHNTPNYLTLLRIIFVPGVVICLSIGGVWWEFAGSVIFGLAGLTDFLDGYYARKLNLETVYGKLMDPLADKFLVICTLIMLQHMQRMHPYIVMLLVSRELTITGLRALASAEGVIVAASQGGKWKTASQMAAIPMLMLKDFSSEFLGGFPLFEIGMALTYISIALSLWSAKDYMVGFFKGLKEAHAARRERNREKRRMKKLRKQAKKLAALNRPEKNDTNQDQE
jgi:CDP-diacylglycerol---glycerol-3-phosphate 3-phosphatidyltransferase